MSREYTPPVGKSTPVSSPLQQSVSSLRVPQIQRRGVTSPSDHNGYAPSSSGSLGHRKKPSRVLSDDGAKKRLVEQFYEHDIPSTGTTPKSTPFITRTNTQELSQAKGKEKLNFLSPTTNAAIDPGCGKTAMIENVRKVEQKVYRSVKKQVEANDVALTEDKSSFIELEQEVHDMKQKVKSLISVIEENSRSADKDYKSFQEEVKKVYGTLSILDQYESAITNSRTKLAANKTKLKGLWVQVEENEKIQALRKENIESRNKAIVGCAIVLLIIIILNKMS
jgi:hypothetical protein